MFFNQNSTNMSDSDLLPGQNLAHLLPPSWREDVHKWYAEDTPSFDWGGFVVGEEDQEAILWGKSGVSR
jgi:nicotinate-nucleotide pyrophosphorylase (carboxylating)